jgi:hypothetical protein
MAVDVSAYIAYGKCTQFLAATEVATQNLFIGNSLVQRYSRQVYIVRKQIQFRQGLDANDSTLDATSNYLYALCGKYIQRAKQIIANMGTGIVINPANGAESTLEDFWLQFIVGTTSSPVNVNGVNVTLPNDGDSQIVIPLTYVSNNSIEFIKGNTPLPIGLNDRESFTPLYTNGGVTINVNDVFQNGDLIVITGRQFVAI